MTGKKVKFFTTKRACLVILCFLFCVATVLFCISIRPTHSVYASETTGYLFKDGAGVTITDPLADEGNRKEGQTYVANGDQTYNSTWGGTAKNKIYANNILLYSSPKSAIPHLSVANITFDTPLVARDVKQIVLKISARFPGNYDQGGYFHKLFAVNDDGNLTDTSKSITLQGISHGNSYQTFKLENASVMKLANSDGLFKTIQYNGSYASGDYSVDTFGFFIESISYELYSGNEGSENLITLYSNAQGVSLWDPLADEAKRIPNEYYVPNGEATYNGAWGGMAKNKFSGDDIILYSAPHSAVGHLSVINMTFSSPVKAEEVKYMKIVAMPNFGSDYRNVDTYFHRLYAVNDDGKLTDTSKYVDLSCTPLTSSYKTFYLTNDEVMALADSNGYIKTIQYNGHFYSGGYDEIYYGHLVNSISYVKYTEQELADKPKYLFNGTGVTLSDPIANGGVADVNYKSVSGLSYSGDWGALSGGKEHSDFSANRISLWSGSRQAGLSVYSVVNMKFDNKITDVRRVKTMSITVKVDSDGGLNNYNFLDKANTHKLYAVNDDGTIGGSIDIADISGIQQNAGKLTLSLTPMQIFALAGNDGEIETIQWSGNHANHAGDFNSYLKIYEISYTTYTDAEYAALPNYFYGVGSGVTLSDPCINGTDGVNYELSSLNLGYNGEWGGLNKNVLENGKIVLYSAAQQFVGGAGSVVNLTFQNKLPNAKKIKSMTFKIQISCDAGANNYPFLNGNNIHRLYAVNTDGTLTGTYMDLADIPGIAGNAGEQTVTIDRTQIMKLANSDGAIETVQWSGHHMQHVIEGHAYIRISEITYEEYTDAEVEALPEIVFTGSEVEITDPWANGTPVAGVNYDPVKGLSYSGDWGNTKENKITDGKLQLWSGDDQGALTVYSIANLKLKNKIKNVDLLKEMSIKIWVRSDEGAFDYPFLVENNTHVLYGLNNDGTLTGKCLNIAEIVGIKENAGYQTLTITHDQALKLADSDGEIENIQWSGHHYNHVNSWNTYVWISEITYNYYTLEEMKAIYSTKLDGYKQEDYSASDWSEISGIISQYKSDVASATDINAIPALLTNAKSALSGYGLAVSKILGRYISLGSSISVITRVNFVGQNTPAMRFVIDGVADVYSTTFNKVGDTIYEFAFTGIGPQSLTDTIKAYLLDGDNEIAYKEFTVVDYLQTAFDNAYLTAEKTLIADIADYGKFAQIFTDHNDANLPEIKGAAPSAFETIASTDLSGTNVNQEEGTTFFGASVEFGNTNKIQILFKVKDAVSNYSIVMSVNGNPVSVSAPVKVDGEIDNLYQVTSTDINAIGFDDVYNVQLKKGATVIQTLTYSIKSYVYSKQNGNNAMADLAKALYKYGVSAKNYLALKVGYTKATVQTPSTVNSVSFEAIGGKDVMPVGGFWGPYGAFNDKVYFEYLKAAGINTILSTGKYDINEFMDTLELCEEYGMGAFLTSSMFNLWSQGEKGLSAGNLEYALRALENDACLGVYGIDEPFQEWFDIMGEVYDLFYNVCDFGEKQIVTNFVGHNTTRPSKSGGKDGELTFEQELEDFIKECNPNLLCFDSYVFTNNRVTYQKKGKQNEGYKDYFAELSVVYNLAKENNIPFWYLLQAGCTEIGNSTIEPNESEFDWNINTALAYGAKGIMYFELFQSDNFYDDGQGTVNGLISATGERNVWYDYAKNIAGQISAIDAVLMNSENKGIICNIASSVESGWIANKDKLASFRELNTVSGGDAMVGCFDYQGKTALYVVNFSRTAQQTIDLNFNGNYGYNVIRNGEGSFATGTTLELTLNAGEGVLVVLD